MEITIVTKSFESPTKPNPFQASLCVSSTRSLLKNLNIQQRLTQDKALRVRASRPDGNSLNSWVANKLDSMSLHTRLTWRRTMRESKGQQGA